VIEVPQTEILARWLERLRDGRARARINARIRRLSVGNPGDVKSVGGGVLEMRIAGGDKKTQSHDIAMAINIARDL